MKKSNETTKNVFVEKATEMYENKESKTRKEAVRAYFKSYDKIALLRDREGLPLAISGSKKISGLKTDIGFACIEAHVFTPSRHL